MEKNFEKVDNLLKEVTTETVVKEQQFSYEEIKERLDYYTENANTIEQIYQNELALVEKSRTDRLASNAELIALWQTRLDQADQLAITPKEIAPDLPVEP